MLSQKVLALLSQKGQDMEAEKTALGMLGRLEEAWNRGDGKAFGAPYREDASHVTVHGVSHHGRDTIGRGHGGIFATVYAGSTIRMELLEARSLGDDVIVATSRHTLDVPEGPAAGVRQAVATWVFVRDADDWRVSASHNTVVAA